MSPKEAVEVANTIINLRRLTNHYDPGGEETILTAEHFHQIARALEILAQNVAVQYYGRDPVPAGNHTHPCRHDLAGVFSVN